MKYLVVIAVVLVVYLIWRTQRASAERPPPPAAPPANGLAQDMVQCPVCSVHLPRGEALIGNDGKTYCSQEHRLRAGSRA